MKDSIDAWQSNMLKFGRIHGDNLIRIQNDADINPALAATYYDAQRVFYSIYDYTLDPYWLKAADAANRVYGGYVATNKGQVPGYENFTRGLAERHRRNSDPVARDAVKMLAENAAFANDYTSSSSTRSAARSRETAYAMLAIIDEIMGGNGIVRPRLALLKEQAFGHARQWLNGEGLYFMPFMVALTCEALIYFETNFPGQEPDIVPTVQELTSLVWNKCWLPDKQSFMYASENVSPNSGKQADGGSPVNLDVVTRDPAPDLNLLIAPMFGWMFDRTGDGAYKCRGDAIFAGGVKGADLEGPKQFNQNYRWSPDYLKWTGQTPSYRPALITAASADASGPHSPWPRPAAPK